MSQMLNKVKKEVKYACIKNYMIDKTWLEQIKELRGGGNQIIQVHLENGH